MGGYKDGMMEREANLSAAAAYLVQKEALEECEAHDAIFGGGMFELDSNFWRDVTSDWKLRESGPVPWAADMKVQEFKDLLKEAYESNCGDGCYQCDKNMED